MSSMFCKKIYQCRNADWCARDYNPKADDPECFEQLTNYDRIISKTPEKLAVWFCQKQFREGDFCPPEHGWQYCQKADGCRECWLSWLKAPVEEVDNEPDS